MSVTPTSTALPTHNADYRPEIDGLRALAVVLVVAYHAFPSLIPGGFIGVDIFFVISGYLITGIILRALDQNRFSIAEFYARRFRRILPALCVMMVVAFLLSWLVLLPDELRDVGKQLMAGTAFAENIFLIKESGYFDIEAVRKPMLHLWSLGVEEQFYLFWPIMLMLAVRYRLKLGVYMPLLAAVSFVFCLYYVTINPVEAFYILPSRFWELLCGAMLIYYERNARESNFSIISVLSRLDAQPLWQNTKALLAVSVTIIFATKFSHGSFYVGWLNVLPCICALLFISAGKNSWLNRIIFSNPPVVLLGRVSYPFYLWHWPILSLLNITENGKPDPTLVIIAVGVALILAWLTYVLIELPFQKHFTFQKGLKPIFMASLAGMLLTGSLGFMSYEYPKNMVAAVPSWLTNSEVQHVVDEDSFQKTIDRNWWGNAGLSIDQACLQSQWLNKHAPDYCRLSDATPRVAILGDSHANHLVPGLMELKDPILSHLIQISFGGCVAFNSVYFHQRIQNANTVKDCYSGNQDFLNAVINDKNIEVVIISMKSYANTNFDDAHPDGTLKLAISPDNAFAVGLKKMEYLREGLSRSIAQLERAGKKVVYVIDVPALEVHPADCVSVRRLSFNHSKLASCTIARERVEKEQQLDMRNMVAELKASHPNMLVFDANTSLCDDTMCSVIRDQKMLYRDSNHLSLDGSIYIARALAKSIKQ
jgi:peptidoglycan/LPS O-acetylase OafA/YrhL